ncbi:hypothetical protein ACFO0A_06560 [Novosphingobium tardum]|uniref:Transposase n=1 Tax=Novosphingobium tardum TaxID=1538021 RepID=A0ABV8RMZ9_9SPHN
MGFESRKLRASITTGNAAKTLNSVGTWVRAERDRKARTIRFYQANICFARRVRPEDENRRAEQVGEQ